jgi:hypothetical protein
VTVRCRKTRYRDELAALFAIDRIANKGRDTGVRPVRAYRCPNCRAWHITSQPNNNSKGQQQ